MKTAVVILNWNTVEYLRAFLPPLLKSVEGMDAEFVVADNASSDGSVQMLSRDFPEVKVLPLDSNYGFTGGYNRAIAQLLEDSDPDYIVLLNSDIEVPQGWLEPLVGHMDSHPECGVCGPKLHALLEEAGSYVRSARFEYAGAAGGWLDRFGYPYCRGRVLSKTEADNGQYDSLKNVMWVSGACLMTRSSLWRQLSGLDERFFAHMEEIDFCWRARLEGWKVTVVPDSCVYHLGGGTLPKTSAFKLKLNYRNGLLMLDNNLARCCGSTRAKLTIFARMVLDGMSAAVYLLSGRTEYVKAVLDAHSEFRRMRNGRTGERKAPANTAEGLGKVCIILQAALRGNGIFNYLKRYEDSH